MHIPYNVEVHDNLISDEIHRKIYQYVQTLEFTGLWLAQDRVKFNYTLDSPRSPGDWMLYQSMGRNMQLHRSALASDEHSLLTHHPIIYLLWKELNRCLGNRFEITGNPEGQVSDFSVPTPQDPTLLPGWRAYVNANYCGHVSRGQGYVHRDTPLEHNDASTVTMLYVVNLEWYPSWAGEIRIYPEDPDGETGDQQQFNWGRQQQRGYKIGWLDQGQVISPKPGRLIIMDGRCLHATTPPQAPMETPSIKIAFRARLK
jgi:hypothetical protein